MKKAKIKASSFDVDGPFLKARERILDFKEGFIFTEKVQFTVIEMQKCEEEYELAVLMDDLDLAKEKSKEIAGYAKSLAFAAKLLEEESGISA
jgi:hypothetical protein|tara:strand:- start:171 stop:449 length:279 start_codon:yes stop_codon:yes gene_type:complete